MISIDVRWPHGHGFSQYHIATYSQLHEVPPSPGLYIWSVRPRNATEVKGASKLYEHASISAKVRGNIRLSYSGMLSKDLSDVGSDDDFDTSDLVPDVYFAVAYPVYIGISRNLRTRLETHKRQFDESLLRMTGTRREFPQDDAGLGEEFDSDAESSYFGSRIASAWPNISKDCLYVKYIIPKECRGCDPLVCGQLCFPLVMEKLRKAEHIANSLFNPVFGRR
jgi:hypothetical protein